MKILLTGATGYIGKRLLPELVNKGHKVVCCVRDKSRFQPPDILLKNIEVIEVDFLNPDSLNAIPEDVEAAYYLIHSMSVSSENFNRLEQESAENFKNKTELTNVKQVIYLSGIVNEKSLSKHLTSRKNVEEILSRGNFSLTALRAGIIVGSGSASFEIIRDLVEKLPVMIAPKWLKTRCQPIAISDVISYLSLCLGNEDTFGKSFDIGGTNILTYKEMLLGYAKARNLKRFIITVPVMTPKLSSYWLFFVTATSYKLAVSLVDSMKVEVICKENLITDLLKLKPKSYEEALSRALESIEHNHIVSSWKDSFVSGRFSKSLSCYIEVPSYGCLFDKRNMKLMDESRTMDKLWAIGGNTGWYYANFLWKIRGTIDKLFGGVGLRRGRTNKTEIHPGDAVDFWRVLFADRSDRRLLLFAEMKLPGEAWLEFKIDNGTLFQTATFRPKGILGRLYWYSVLPFHAVVFGGMIKKLAE